MDDAIQSFKDSFEHLQRNFALGVGVQTWVVTENLKDDVVKVKSSVDRVGELLEDKSEIHVVQYVSLRLLLTRFLVRIFCLEQSTGRFLKVYLWLRPTMLGGTLGVAVWPARGRHCSTRFLNGCTMTARVRCFG